MEILTPWLKIAHPNQYGKPFINPDPSPRPADPEIPPNPDDPENTGDNYWVVSVPLRSSACQSPANRVASSAA
jgi:hypothetical protein